MISYFTASWKLSPGTQVRLTETVDAAPFDPVPSGASGTVIDNNLCDSTYPLLTIEINDGESTVVEIAGPGMLDDAKPYDADNVSTHEPWHKVMPIEVIA